MLLEKILKFKKHSKIFPYKIILKFLPIYIDTNKSKTYKHIQTMLKISIKNVKNVNVQFMFLYFSIKKRKQIKYVYQQIWPFLKFTRIKNDNLKKIKIIIKNKIYCDI